MTECLFCQIVNEKIPADIIYDDDEVLAFRDINPQAPVHVLLIPKRYITNLNAIREDDGPLLARLMRVSTKLARNEGIAESGYRVVTNCQEDAGQSVLHLHFHLLGGRRMTWPPG